MKYSQTSDSNSNQNKYFSEKSYQKKLYKQEQENSSVKSSESDNSDSEQYKNYSVKDLVEHCRLMNKQIIQLMQILKLDMDNENKNNIQLEKLKNQFNYSSDEEKNKQDKKKIFKNQYTNTSDSDENLQKQQPKKIRSVSSSNLEKINKMKPAKKNSNLQKIFTEDLQMPSDNQEIKNEEHDKKIKENLLNKIIKVEQNQKPKKIRPPKNYIPNSDDDSELNILIAKKQQLQKSMEKKVYNPNDPEKIKKQDKIEKAKALKQQKQNLKFEKKMAKIQYNLEKKVQKEQINKRRLNSRQDLSSFKLVYNFDGTQSYACGVCEKNFRSRSRVQQHLRRVCMRGKIMKCPFIGCRKVYTQEENYLKHMELHQLNNDKK